MRQTKKRGIEFILIIILLIFTTQLVLADVYKPYLHDPTVPEHPSLDVQGTYETNLWLGAATYDYPLIVPSGINGLQPIISLDYNSLLTYQQPSITGTAWRLTENYIQRDVAYSFSNTSNDKFKLILNGQLYNLVYDSSDKRFHTEIESYLYVQNVSGGNNSKGTYWTVKNKDGATYRFGYNQDSELVSNLHNYSARWSLDLISDTHNNNIYYSYLENPYSNDTGAVYPYKIEYNNDKSRVIEFVLESSDRPDKWLIYEQGNKRRESRRIQEIQIKANGNLVRKYVLNYSLLDTTSKSILSSITVYGSDGVISLSPVKFEYYNVTKGWMEDKSFSSPITLADLGSDYGARLVDLNRDGLIDITEYDGFQPEKSSWINNGSGWIQNDSWNVPEAIVNESYWEARSDTGVRFIDFNGDGFTDLVRGDGSLRKSYQNSMNGWVLNSTWNLPINAQPVDLNSDIFERGVRFEDINGDGLPDILSATDDWNYAWINNGSGWKQDDSWKVPSEAIFSIYPSGQDKGVRIFDTNGDGLVDLVKGNVSGGKIWLNNGSGWVYDSSWLIPTGAYFVNASGTDEGVRFMDLNGDGLTDIVKGKQGNGTAWVNNGHGWTEDSAWEIPGSADFVYDDGRNLGLRIVDVNGDGLLDLMNGGFYERTFINKASRAFLLKNVTNNVGGSISLNYIKSTSFSNSGVDNISDMGFSLWLVNTFSEENGMNNAQKLSSIIEHAYSNGFYDYNKKEFRGFNHVDEIKPNISIIKHWFYQNDSRKGKEYKIELFDSNSKPFAEIEYEWNKSEINNYSIVTLLEETNYLYDGSYDLPKITETKYSYDNYGNILSVSYLGENSTQNDGKYEYFEYAYNTSNWIVNKPKRYALYSYDNSTKIREIFYRYDGLNYGDSPIKGDLSWEEQWLNTGDNPIIKYSYNDNGNLVNETDANGRVTQYIYGIRDITNTFVDRIIDAKGFITNFNYDLGTGNLLWTSDTNSFVTNYTYDLFGRIEKEILPYDSSTYPTKEYNYSLDGIAPENIKVMQREDSGALGTLDSYYFYDGLGNLIQTKKEAEDSKQIVNDIYYDALGRIIKQSNPYFITTDAGYSNPDLSVSAINYSYDSLSRIIQIKNQDNTIKNITFDHWKTIYYDENGNKKIYYLDAYNQIIKVVEYLTDNYLTTKYAYDVAGTVIQINDSYGNTINYTYDSLGRKTQENNIDSGTWKYYYDAAGNLINQTDNKGINISLQYDELNRVIKKSSPSEMINYTYDQINGTLWKTETPVLIVNYTYDNKLRNIKTTEIIDGKIFTKQWNYDAMDRVKTETLPDNSVINYNYTLQGQIKQITNVLNNVDYNALKQPIKMSYKNNLDTNYTYNVNTFRIEKVKTTNKQELNYGYDNVGNVVNINDTSNNFFISMIYDNLDRLTYSKREGNNNFEYNYTYNFLGNILKIIGGTENMTYFYNLNPKHAPYLITKTGISSPANDTHKFRIDMTGEVVAWLGNEGNIVLKGNCYSGGSCDNPGPDSFIIANETDGHVAFINSTGDMCVEKGDCSDQSATCDTSPEDAFIIKNASNNDVIYFDKYGDLCLIGELYENADL